MFTITMALATLLLEAPTVASERPVTLLVHGISLGDRGYGSRIWGRAERRRRTGLLGHLVGEGWAWGGVLKPRAGIPMEETLDRRGATSDPSDARLFSLDFTEVAGADGLALKALEVAEAVRTLRRITGRDQVRLVAHSAGGLAARVWLQSALPGLPFRDEVDRLITIGTPHLGSAQADAFGDLIGTRVTSLGVEAPLVRALNERLELPATVDFASIIVRGIAADVRGSGHRYRSVADPELLGKLPRSLTQGGDQVVHALSQNLALAPAARRYERSHGRPVQYVLARVPDRKRGDGMRGRLIHTRAPRDATVCELVCHLLRAPEPWEGLPPRAAAAWRRERIALHVRSVVESAALRKHPASEVREVTLSELTRGEEGRWSFAGIGHTVGGLIGVVRHRTEVRGRVRPSFDRFGRLSAFEAKILSVRDARRGR